MVRRSATAIAIHAGLGLVGVCDSPAQNREHQSLCVLLDTSGEMGFVVPRVRKEVRYLNAELKKMVAEQALDIRMLKDLNSKKW